MKKKSNILFMAALLFIVSAGLMSCVKTYKIQVSTNNLWFGLNAGSLTMDITANCKWTITKQDVADWYTINTMSGKNDATLIITVDPLENADFRMSRFVIESPGGHVHRTVFVSQNKLDFEGLYNKVFGVMNVEHWNTDYFGQMIEDSYKHGEFDPYDTATGYTMYFLENGTGVQCDHHDGTAVYFEFTYEYNPINQIFHIEFETVDEGHENYDANVLTASDSLYRFMHEYKPHFWERADMRKIGVISNAKKEFLLRNATKRKGGEPIFQF